MAYDAYGEIVTKGANGMAQEHFAYDGAGRLWRTNSGDGVYKIYGYDKAGNQTLALASGGTGDLSTYTSYEAAYGDLTTSGAHTIGSVS